MKVRFLPLAIFALLLVQTFDLFSQGANPLEPEKKGTPIYVGPVIGFNRTIHTANLASFADNLCPSFSNGTANGFFAGLSAEYLLGNAANSKSSIIARVLYNSMPASFTQGGDEYPSLITTATNKDTTVLSSTKHSLDVTYNFLSIEAMYKLNLFNTTFGICAGPTFDLIMQKKIYQVYDLLTPLNAQFKRADNWQQLGYQYINNDRTIVVQDKNIDNANSFRIGIRAGVTYEILMGRLYLVPGLFFNYGITPVSSKESWNVHAFQAELDARWSL